MRKSKFALIAFTIFLSLFISGLPFNVLVFSQTIDEAYGYTEIYEDFDVDGIFFVPPGETLVIKKGVTVSVKSGSIIIQGKLIIKGTVEEPVKIKKTEEGFNYSLEVWQGGELEMMNVDVTGGGLAAQIISKKKSIFNTAFADAFQGAVHVNNGRFSAQNVNFHDNIIAISISGNDSVVKVNRSKFLNNNQNEVIKSGSGLANFQYNWWGNENGPVMNCEIYNSCWPISGEIDFSNYLTKAEFIDPVIVIPGILGSWKWTNNGDWKLDPIFKTYDSLIEVFKDNGYEEGENLFTFPYQWRDSNVNNAVLLKEKIKEIREAKNWPKVDIVAHSMGGLLAREYIEADYYQDDIDQLVMLGTPNRGAPSDYYIWDGGEMSFNKLDSGGFFLSKIFSQEAKEAGFANIFDYLHNMPIQSVQELLPDYDYLKESTNGELRIYPDNYPRNEFLEKLNKKENVRKLNSVSVVNIIGNLEENKTIASINIGSSQDSIWQHGKPESFEYSKGDGTVPKFSSENILFDDQEETDFLHTELPGRAASLVYEKITGYSPQKEVPFAGIDSIMVVFVFSPIDIQVISPSGKWIGKNIKNLNEDEKLEDGYYAGHETINEFLTIPNPENGEYEIVSEGNDSGDYKIVISKIFKNEEGEIDEVSNEIIGVAEIGAQETKKIEIDEEGISIGIQDDAPPEILIESPRNKKYKSDEIVLIDFSVKDDLSGVDEGKTKFFLNDESISFSELDAAYLLNNKYEFGVKASDNAGNISEEKVEFYVFSDINSVISNVENYYLKNYITKKSTKNFLDAKLRIVQRHMDMLNYIKKLPWPIKLKRRLEISMVRLINQEISKLILDIQKQKKLSKTILDPVKDILISNLKEIKK